MHHTNASSGLPVVAPNSAPTFLKSSPSLSKSSVGNGPKPTRVVYALTIPTTEVILVGGIPDPVHAPPEVGFDDVTKGYVPKSTSNNAPWAPSNKIDLPSSRAELR